MNIYSSSPRVVESRGGGHAAAGIDVASASSQGVRDWAVVDMVDPKPMCRLINS